MSDGSVMKSEHSRYLTIVPSSWIRNTVGVTLSTATMSPSRDTARPATMSMKRMEMRRMNLPSGENSYDERTISQITTSSTT